MLGMAVGVLVEDPVGEKEGALEGAPEGGSMSSPPKCQSVGIMVEAPIGETEGIVEGTSVGRFVSLAVGTTVGAFVLVGDTEGMTVGTSVGPELGFGELHFNDCPVGENDGT